MACVGFPASKACQGRLASRGGQPSRLPGTPVFTFTSTGRRVITVHSWSTLAWASECGFDEVPRGRDVSVRRSAVKQQEVAGRRWVVEATKFTFSVSVTTPRRVLPRRGARCFRRPN